MLWVLLNITFPGLGVSLTLPWTPKRMLLRIDADEAAIISYLSNTFLAIANVVGSGTVGPEDTAPKSSPTTSETTSESTSVPAVFSTSLPPEICDRVFPDAVYLLD